MPRQLAGGLVYATDHGRMCPLCRRPVDDCCCAAAPAVARAAGDGIVRVGRESKGRGGKTVTAIRGAALDAVDLAALGKKLRTACGAGGTVKDGVIEVQGDHCQRLIELLTREGFKVKRAGG
ncbi:MAG: translation initiation factor Sui1 [Rhodobacteraceae bacterium]|nr:translation initiation factor Sui1 [Paracoccaceae bacterium]